MKKTKKDKNTKTTTWEIFKVQVSLFSSDTTPQVLIYNEQRTIETILDLTKDVKKLMRGEPKAFFWGRRKGTNIELATKDGQAEWQDW